eukprot:TRINITY_DN13663_c0_g1_i1.p1 TRINITY_DN13663_c0_g1~~TRINITY_DN13663_c0_g1_i1.p1  ORF type:complete len:1108 (-),score=337.52 TRINITY_DN13663_c0_g1_i1:663-3986(-)
MSVGTSPGATDGHGDAGLLQSPPSSSRQTVVLEVSPSTPEQRLSGPAHGAAVSWSPLQGDLSPFSAPSAVADDAGLQKTPPLLTPASSQAISRCSPGDMSMAAAQAQAELEGMLAISEERSSRRSEAIQMVLSQLRLGGQEDGVGGQLPREMPPLPLQSELEPRSMPPVQHTLLWSQADAAAAEPQQQSNGVASAGLLSEGDATPQASATTLLQFGSPDNGFSDYHQSPDRRQRMSVYAQGREERLEEQMSVHTQELRAARADADIALEEAQRWRQAVLGVEATMATENQLAAEVEGALRSELREAREKWKQERERFREEIRRLQGNSKDLQGRYRAEHERLAGLQEELARQKAMVEQLECTRSGLQDRLHAAEQELLKNGLGTQHSTRSQSPGFRTEQRGRIRSLLEEHKTLQGKIQELERSAEEERGESDEQLEHLEERLRSQRRGKEAAEKRLLASEEEHAQSMGKAELERMRKEAAAAQTTARNVEALNRGLEAEVQLLQQRLVSQQQGSHLMWEAPDGKGKNGHRELHVDKRLDAELMEEVFAARQQLMEARAAAVKSEDRALQMEQGLLEEEAGSHQLRAELREHAARSEQEQVKQAKVEEAKRLMIQRAMDEQARQLQGEYAAALQDARKQVEEECTALRRALRKSECTGDRDQSSLLQLRQRASEFESQLSKQVQSLVRSEEAMTLRSRQELQAAQDEDAKMRDMMASLQEQKAEALTLLERHHDSESMRLHGEYNGECMALRRLQADFQSHVEAEVAVVASRHETEEVVRSQAALKAEMKAMQRCIVAAQAEVAHQYSQAVRNELREAARREILLDVQENPCSALRKELCQDLRQELRDQVRVEMRSEVRSELRSQLQSHELSASPIFSSPFSAITSAASPRLSRAGGAAGAAGAAGSIAPISLFSPGLESVVSQGTPRSAKVPRAGASSVNSSSLSVFNFSTNTWRAPEGRRLSEAWGVAQSAATGEQFLQASQEKAAVAGGVKVQCDSMASTSSLMLSPASPRLPAPVQLGEGVSTPTLTPSQASLAESSFPVQSAPNPLDLQETSSVGRPSSASTASLEFGAAAVLQRVAQDSERRRGNVRPTRSAERASWQASG